MTTPDATPPDGLGEAEREALQAVFAGWSTMPNDLAPVVARLVADAEQRGREGAAAALGSTQARIWVDPARCGGSPAITGTRITTEAAAGMVLTHGVATALDCWPHLDADDLKAACWYEAYHGKRRKFREAFKSWAETYSEAMWRSQWADVPEPEAATRIARGQS